MEAVEFTSTPVTTDRGHVRVPLPFDPRERWGRKPRHDVEGTVTGTPFSGSVGFAVRIRPVDREPPTPA
jgi:hypothetical protein